MRNPGTRLGRPPAITPLTQPKTSTGEKQGLAPMDQFDSAVPGAAFKRGGSVMPKHHDDEDFYDKKRR
jgi:hypothetical protein